MEKKYDVIIIGAGPAGLKCAEVLAKNNKRVLVLEKNKVLGKKVCAGGITYKVLEMGIPKSIIQKRFNKVIFHTPLQKREIYLKNYPICTINREDLGKWMASKAKAAGALIKTNSEVIKIDKKFVYTSNGKYSYTSLVGADGSSSLVRNYLHIPTNRRHQAFHYITSKKFKKMELFYEPSIQPAAYLWIFPHKKFTSIGTGGDLRGGSNPPLGRTIHKIKEGFDNWCKDKFNLDKSKFEAALINYDYKGYHFGNIFLVGDAAGMASGFTGEGIYFAIKSGEDVALKIIDKNYECPNIKYIIGIKFLEEKLLESFEINKGISEVEAEFLAYISKLKFIDELGAKILD